MKKKISLCALVSLLSLSSLGAGGKRPGATSLENNGVDSDTQINLASGSQESLRGLPQSFNCEPTKDFKICMICNCYHEGRGESLKGQIGVARTVYTRSLSSHYPSNPCSVVYQPSQFSWTLKSSKRRQRIGPGVRSSRFDRSGFKRCVASTQASLKYKNQWFASNYHTTSIRPKWASACRGRVRVDDHYFYTGGCYNVRPDGPRKRTKSATSVAMICTPNHKKGEQQ